MARKKISQRKMGQRVDEEIDFFPEDSEYIRPSRRKRSEDEDIGFW